MSRRPKLVKISRASHIGDSAGSGNRPGGVMMID
jgi:hypothetical protein